MNSIERLHNERTDLITKTQGLTKFLKSSTAINDTQRMLLISQLSIMNSYVAILTVRIDNCQAIEREKIANNLVDEAQHYFSD